MRPFWSIVEVCVWIASRDLDEVDVVHGEDPEGVHFLIEDGEEDHAGHVVLHRRRALERSGGKVPPGWRLSRWEAFRSLPLLFGSGTVPVLGKRFGEGDVEPVPPAAWSGLELGWAEGQGVVAKAPKAAVDPGAAWWGRLRLRSQDVLQVWPAATEGASPVDAPASQPVPARGPTTSVPRRDALRELVKQGLLSLYPPTGQLPAGVSVARAGQELSEIGINAEASTILRALGRKP